MAHFHSHDHHHHADDHGHHHISPSMMRKKSQKRLFVVLALTSSFMLIEAVVGFFTGSLALLADAGHMLGDTGAVALSLFAFWMAARPARPENTYGYHRVEIFASLLNALALIVIFGFVLYESIQRLTNGHSTHMLTEPVLVVAVIGALINIASAFVLHDVAQHSLNTKSAYLEVITDLLGSLSVIASSLVTLFTGFYFADTIAAVFIGFLIVPRTWSLLAQSVHILMEGTPKHIKLGELTQAVSGVPGVISIHDLHVWTITSGMESVSGHVVISPERSSGQILESINNLMREQFGIAHVTIQIEAEEHKACAQSCHTMVGKN